MPFLIVSLYLFARFKHAFSRHTNRNISKIAYLMLSENVLNCILRFFVGLKLLFFEKMTLKNFLVPAVFGAIWAIVAVLAYQKQGNYGAHRGMLYMQEEQEKKNEKVESYYGSEQSTFHDDEAENLCNKTIINFEDTEGLMPCNFSVEDHPRDSA